MIADAPSARILVADPSPFGRAWAARVLRDAGHDVVAVGDGDDTLERARDLAPDAMVLECARPGARGQSVARALRALQMDAGVVMMLERDASEAEALREGADLILRRPCSDAALGRAVGRALELGAERRERRERERHYEGEMLAAAAIQEALLPPDPPMPRGWRLETGYMPSRVVGGDAYDLILDPSGGRLVMVVCDVSGKGVAGALVAAMFVTAVRAAVEDGATPCRALARAGALLFDTLERVGRFLTATVVAIGLGDGSLEYADAGHRHHLLIGADGAPRPLEEGGPPIGFLPRPELSSGREVLEPGAALAVFSDGLVEGPGRDDPVVALAALTRGVRAGRPAPVLVSESPDDDDRTLVVVRRAS